MFISKELSRFGFFIIYSLQSQRQFFTGNLFPSQSKFPQVHLQNSAQILTLDLNLFLRDIIQHMRKML